MTTTITRAASLSHHLKPESPRMSYTPHTRSVAFALLGLSTLAALPSAQAASPAVHFTSICRSDPAVSKNTVTVSLHGADEQLPDGSYLQSHAPLAGVTLNVLWTYVDYRQNRAVFKYRQDSCTTNNNGVCTFHGGSGRARWQLAEVVGYDLSTPAFDTLPTTNCPNTTMIDFW